MHMQLKTFPVFFFLTTLVFAPTLGIANPFGSHGSCDSINQASVCLDYTGSYWAGKQTEMKLNCEGSGSTYRSEPCPFGVPWEGEVIGDCAVGLGQAIGTILRYYWVGGGGLDDPNFNVDLLRLTCERSGGVWQWGMGAGTIIPVQ